MFKPEILKKFAGMETPFYYYDMDLLRRTLTELKKAAPREYHVHYALKANAAPEILGEIREGGLGADCVSGNEVRRALDCGFDASSIVFAGVGKSDKEIEFALGADIFCFNAESVEELKVLDQLASGSGRKAGIALRINPNVDAYTHKYITTGLEENKFGINPYEFDMVLNEMNSLKNLEFLGLHFHIGSQITDLNPYRQLCSRVNEINRWFIQKGHYSKHINVGGGLGINYKEPDKESIPDFASFFSAFTSNLELNKDQQVHFELGRALVGQCGSLISRVLYVKKGISTNFAILDAGMTELIRPALYQAYHKIENISNAGGKSLKYDVVGPICESSDCFGKAVEMSETKRGDIIAIRSAGAYGEVMSSRYNLRDEVKSCFF